jgi:hypothetical protein
LWREQIRLTFAAWRVGHWDEGFVMATQNDHQKRKTAVLVVHGMGSQRPLATLRGLVDAVWLDNGAAGQKRVWFHPELSGIDLDLPVITGGAPSKEGMQKVDFHEFYWAHLMSETRAVAVLLWLFELARKGPRLNPGIGALWWGSAIFLSFLILSVAFLAIQGIDWLVGLTTDRGLLLLAPVGLIAIVTACAAAVFAAEGAYKLVRATVTVTLVAVTILAGFYYVGFAPLNFFATNFLPAVIALLAVRVLMGWWGVAAFAVACALSGLFYVCLSYTSIESDQIIPWSIDSQWSAVLAWLNIAAYLIFNAMFLQPYLGDAARYFRNAPANVAVRREIRRDGVETLDHLHAVGGYDRIIVVAHSLGSVIAYDMLRAYFARVAHHLPAGPDIRDDKFDRVDAMTCKDVDALLLRENARNLVKKFAAHAAKLREHAGAGDGSAPSSPVPKCWLVTDFVTLGSPLTHAHYLMCDGETHKELRKDFLRRVRERELPTCPPARIDNDGRLTFDKSGAPQRVPRHERLIHHGALFGITRWTNLYFPASNLFWGDAIGGPVQKVFGKAVVDVPISVNAKGIADFFSHITYWDIEREGGRAAPHIQKLRKALNLSDGPDDIAKESLPARKPHGRAANP